MTFHPYKNSGFVPNTTLKSNQVINLDFIQNCLATKDLKLFKIRIIAYKCLV